MGFSHRLAFVVPTRNRPADLRRMLRSVEAQSTVADEIILVDGGDPGQTVADVPAEFPGLALRYLRIYPPGLSKQRNAGMDAVSSDMTLAGYIDDDG